MIEENLKHLHQLIKSACQKADRTPETVTLVAVSKRHSVEKIREAFATGQVDFGENYLNEALEKQALLSELGITWHFIGHIQSNKTRKIAEHFAWVHTVDSLKIARRLSSQRPAELPPLNICLQINVDNEDSKSGLSTDKSLLLNLAREIDTLPNIKLRGLMCIPAPKSIQEDELATFTQMKVLQDYLNSNDFNLDTLSMGMSDDLDSAIMAGSTMIRIGTAIFGQRQ